MKNKPIVLLAVILILILSVSLFFLIRGNFQKGNLEMYRQAIEKMKQGGKTHTLLPDLDHLLSRPFLQPAIRSHSYLLAAYINYRRNNHRQADQLFRKIKFEGTLFDIRDYIYYWWGKTQWQLYKQTGEATWLKQAGSNFNKVVTSDLSPMKKEALFRYIKSCYHSNDTSFDETLPKNLIDQVGQLSKSDLPEFLYILGESYLRQGNIDNCLDHFVRLWKEYPYSDWAKKAEGQLETMGKSSLIDYPQLPAGELLDIYDLKFKWDKSKVSQEYLKDRLGRLQKIVPKANRQLTDRFDLLYGKIYYYSGPWKKANDHLSRAFRSGYPEIKVEAAYYLMRHAMNYYHFSTLKRIVNGINSRKYMESEYFEKTAYLAGFPFMRKKRYREAISLYRVVLRKESEDKFYYNHALWRLQWCYFHLKEYKKAREVLEKLRETEEWQEYALYWTAYIYQKEKKMDEARALYRQLLLDSGYTYYGILADRTLQKDFKVKVDFEKNLQDFVPYQVGLIEDKNRSNRYQILTDNGLYEFAALELKTYLNEKKISSETDDEYWKPYGSTLAKLYFYSSQYILCGLYIYRVYKEFVLRGGKNIPQWFWDMYYPLFYKDLIDKYSRLYEVNRDFLYAFIRQESYYEPFAVSPAGAIGVMQIMPNTGRGIFNQIGSQLGLTEYSVQLLYQPEVNIPMGIYHLKYNLFDKIKKYIREKGIYKADNENIINPLLIAGYNAGLRRAYRWVKETTFDNQQELIDQIDIAETRRYVKLVLKHIYLYRKHHK